MNMKIKDLDKLTIEQIIRLPFFHTLEKDFPTKDSISTETYWKITLRCNKTTASGWALLDEFSDNEYIVRYKIIDFK